MNEEKLSNIEQKPDSVIQKENIDSQVENSENVKLAKADENVQQLTEVADTVDDVPHKSDKRSTATFAIGEPITQVADDDDNHLNEISFGRHSDTDTIGLEEEVDFYEGFEGEEEHERGTARFSLFNPNCEAAVELKTETKILRLSRLPRVAPVDLATSLEQLFMSRMISKTSLDTLESSSPSNESILSQKEYEEPKERGDSFFEKLGQVPEVKDIQSDSLLSTDYKLRHYNRIEKPIYGRFVDPLTGKSIETIVFEETKEVETHEDLSLEEEIEEEEKTELDENIFENFDSIFLEDDEKRKTIQQVVHEEVGDAVDLLLGKKLEEGKLEFRAQYIDEVEIEQEHVIVDKFFDDIVKRVVRFFEERESFQFVREKLDKKALFKEIGKVVKDYLTEIQIKEFLSRKAVNYYRRKRNMRNITPEQPELLAYEHDRYKEACQHLDHVLGKEVAMNTKTRIKINSLFIEQDEMEEMEKAERHNFIELVKRTLKRDHMPKLEEIEKLKIIDKELEKMFALGEEISQVRAVYISRQHMLGTIKAQLDELENIGDGLKVADYETIQRETIRLEKKIEENNNDLRRLYERFRCTIHTMGHSKLRNEMCIDYIRQQIKHLTTLDDEKSNCRLYLYKLKKRRQQIQHQIEELSYQCGLLDKPAMLLDYDDTVEIVEKKRIEVKNLRENFKSLEQKLKRAEASCK